MNDTPLFRTAVKSLTGIAISPNEMVPLQIYRTFDVGRCSSESTADAGVDNRRSWVSRLRAVLLGYRTVRHWSWVRARSALQAGATGEERKEAHLARFGFGPAEQVATSLLLVSFGC